MRHPRCKLEGIHELDGEEPGFLGQGLGAGPVAGFAGIAGLAQEAANFFDEVALGCVQDFAVGLLQIFLRDAGVFNCAAAHAGLIAGRKLRRDLWRGSARGLLGLSVRGGGFSGFLVRRRQRFRVRRFDGQRSGDGGCGSRRRRYGFDWGQRIGVWRDVGDWFGIGCGGSGGGGYWRGGFHRRAVTPHHAVRQPAEKKGCQQRGFCFSAGHGSSNLMILKSDFSLRSAI